MDGFLVIFFSYAILISTALTIVYAVFVYGLARTHGGGETNMPQHASADGIGAGWSTEEKVGWIFGLIALAIIFISIISISYPWWEALWNG